MADILDYIPRRLVDFVVVTLLSLVIGLAQRRLHTEKEEFEVFGSDRTLTFIGILGFILYIIDDSSITPYLIGFLAIIVFLAVYYFFRLKEQDNYGITTIVIALITYCIAPLVITQPAWLYILVVVTVLIFYESKSSFIEISQKFDKDEFITLAKFLIIAGVILPIVPDKQIVPFINLTPFNVWIAVVVVSAVSYMSYLLRKFVFAESGIIVTGLLGGIYSSTATTVILSRKSKYINNSNESYQYGSAIILSIAMMYLRIGLLMFIFNLQLAIYLLPIILTMTLFSAAAGLGIIYKTGIKNNIKKDDTVADKNPLEFKVAIIFTLLFIAFSFINYLVIDAFGVSGLNALSWIVGLVDIDPFLLNIFQGKYDVSLNVIALASMQAIISNNILKTVYAIFLAEKKLKKIITYSMSAIILLNGILVLFLL